MNLRSVKGFSLIELMIVVAIIGILAAVAIPNYNKFQTKSRQSEARANLAAIYAAEKAFSAEWAQFYDDFVEIGYVPEGLFRYEHGFTAGVNSPPTYTGLIGAGAAATRRSTATCGTAPAFADFHPSAAVTVNCSVDRAPASGAVAALAGATLTAATFIAEAHGNIDNDAATDRWSVNESKQIFGPCSAVTPCTQAGQNGGDLDN